MNKYDALFEDEDDIIAGTPKSRYWDIWGQLEEDKVQFEFDKIIAKIAAMEEMLMAHYGEEALDGKVSAWLETHSETIDQHKKSLYMDYAAKLIFAQHD